MTADQQVTRLMRELQSTKVEVQQWPEWLKRELGIIPKRRIRPALGRTPMTDQQPQEQCEHKWEDAQLRATRDGLLICSVDFCALCGTHDFSRQLEAARHPQREWRVCASHPSVDPQNQWGCPGCVAELRRENAELREAAKEIMPLVWFGVAAVSKDGGDFAELAAHAERLNALLNKEAK